MCNNIIVNGSILGSRGIFLLKLSKSKINESLSSHRIPVVDVDVTAWLGKKRRKRQDFFSDFDNNFVDDIVETDPSVEFYPKPYCDIVESKFVQGFQIREFMN